MSATTIKKITVLYNTVEEVKTGRAEDKLAEGYNYKAAKDVSDSLIRLGYEVTLFDLNTKTLKLLTNIKTDLIFNLLEGFENFPGSFVTITSYLESLGFPVTGTSSLSAMMTIDKARTKEFLNKHRIPTPNYQLFLTENEPLWHGLRYPLITKPNSADASVGITQDSVVRNAQELRERIAFIRSTYKDATLVEEYIDGKELDVYGVRVGDDVFLSHILEAIFFPDESRKWDICDFEHKWGEKGYCDEICPSPLPDEVTERVYQMVRDVIRVFDIKGYMRLDIRMSSDFTPYIVEVNTNPGLELSSGSVNITNFATKGITYDEFIQMIVDSALLDFEKSFASNPLSKDTNLIQSE